jgi:hypothetical protein
MDLEAIKHRVQGEIINNRFPELSGIEPQVESGPAESQLRALRRTRAVVSDSDIKAIPVEVKLIYQLQESAERPFDKTIVVVTNEQGDTQFIIESK